MAVRLKRSLTGWLTWNSDLGDPEVPRRNGFGWVRVDGAKDWATTRVDWSVLD